MNCFIRILDKLGGRKSSFNVVNFLKTETFRLASEATGG
jgi:hypothetical protein